MMKASRNFSIVLLLIMLANTMAISQNSPDSLKTTLNQFLDQWHRDAAGANHAAYIDAMMAGGRYIGTDATENWSTEAFSVWSKPWFDKGKTWNFHAVSRNIYLSPDFQFAWFDELLSTQMGLCRGSGTLIKQAQGWKIAHYVLSAAIPNDQMSQVTQMKAGRDTALLVKTILDKYNLTGTILILDPATGKSFGYAPEKWDSGYLPASTFKIPNALIALETGITDTSYIFKWDGEKRRLPQWEQDLNLREAFRVSCVPCFRQLARETGAVRMKSMLDLTGYPGMDVNPGNVDLFWLEGESRITPRQQVDFIRRLYDEKLPLKQAVMQTVKAIMFNEVTPEYRLSAKTGWAIRNGNNYGWFVGYFEKAGHVWFFATLVEPKNQDNTADFGAARKALTVEVWKNLVR